MANSVLFDNWTFKRNISKEFNKVSRTSIHFTSRYNTVKSGKMATLHQPSLTALIKYIKADLKLEGMEEKIGVGKRDSVFIAEYSDSKRNKFLVNYNSLTYDLTAGQLEYGNNEAIDYIIDEKCENGSAVFLAIIPKALEDSEFYENFICLRNCFKDGLKDVVKASEYAYILCDNLYRRIENADNLSEGIKINISADGCVRCFTKDGLKNKKYSPKEIILGNFSVVDIADTKNAYTRILSDESYANKEFYLSNRNYNEYEQNMMITMPEWYILPNEIKDICLHIKSTESSSHKINNIMLRGDAGTGKTAGAKAIAQGLGIPYVFMTCSAETEKFDFEGQLLPITENKVMDVPSFKDIRMDCATAYYKMTGKYIEDIGEEEVYQKLIEVVSGEKQEFSYIESPLIKAFRNGYLIEIQEASVIINQGVLVGFNGLLDECASITLSTGEIVKRHPNTIVVFTTNVNYNSCNDLNQSVISRMDLIIDMNRLDKETMIERVVKITSCTEYTII